VTVANTRRAALAVPAVAAAAPAKTVPIEMATTGFREMSNAQPAKELSGAGIRHGENGPGFALAAP